MERRLPAASYSSANYAAANRSSSWSSRCLIAVGKSLGRTLGRLMLPNGSELASWGDLPLAALARELLPQRRGQAWSNDCRGCSWTDDAATNRIEQRSPRVFQMEHVVVALAAPFSGYLVV